MKKRHSFKRACLLLACIAACGFCGCRQEAQSGEQSGILISQEKAHDKETEAYAQSVVFSMLKYATQKKTGVSLNEKTLQKLEGLAKDVQTVLANNPLNDELYRTFMEKVEHGGKAAIDEVLAYTEKDGEEKSFTAIKTLYLDLSSTVGADYVGGSLYDLGVYFYQYRYEEAMANYEKYGYTYLKKDAEKYQAEQTALMSGVGKANFTTVVKSGFAFADLAFGEGMQAEQIAAFTDAEVLTFVKKLGLDTLTVNEDGWQWLLSYMIPDDGGRYEVKLAKLLKEYDLSEAARSVKISTELLSSIVNKLEEKDVAYLREGDFSSWGQSVFQRFDEADWALFEEMTTLNLHLEYYDALAAETYGAAYVQYKESLTVFTLADLQAAVGTDNFYNVLRGYIAGISPAFSYGMTV